ncbi:mechanosensitive channel MscK [Rodentibacter caecimuris]|uniref:Mechanosensitive channel MscK n=1 Tax=Rodentibacter caecimuris TaxID=1796644 RepID=A0ABX3KWG2_9PAST|nr:hypothetical protein BKG89_09585 [Rodentibacter heylii]
MKLRHLLSVLFLAFWGSSAYANQPAEANLQEQLSEVPKIEDREVKTALIEGGEKTSDLAKQITDEQQKVANLQKLLDSVNKEIEKNNVETQALKKQTEQFNAQDYAKQFSENLDTALTELLAKQRKTQEKQAEVNALISAQNTVFERSQTQLADNAKRSQTLNTLIAASSEKTNLLQQYRLELKLIELKNSYIHDLLKNNDQLGILYQSRFNLLNETMQLQQKQVLALQESINQKNLKQTQNQVEQAQQQLQNAGENSYIQDELDRNTKLSQHLLQQTEKTNTLTQDELRIRNVLDNLTQAQRTIDEQISALQGTLVLSRIIQQQKQRLPTNLNIQGLAKQIADLRVQIFDMTQRRNELYDLDAYIQKVEQENGKNFTTDEKTQVKSLLTERRKMASDLIASLNNQLNLALKLELTQQQITQISDQIQSKLDQQSFWVKSNNPIDLDWIKEFPHMFFAQLDGMKKKLDFQTNYEDLSYLLTIVVLLSLIGGIVFKFKERIKNRLITINGEINLLNKDSQWHTPIALLLTAILALPSTLWFLAICQLIGFFFFRYPLEFSQWAFSMAIYWWFFSFILALFRPQGIAVRHFGFSQQSVATFRSVGRRIIIASVLLLNTSVLSSAVENGLANDVLGELNTIAALIFCIFIIIPRFNNAMVTYKNEELKNKETALFKLVHLLLPLLPIGLIVLVVLGYYYTALNLIKHGINTYMAWMLWSIARHTIYRGISVSSRRLARRRLLEKREKKLSEQNDGTPSDDSVVLSDQEEGIALNDVRSQFQRFADLFIWTALIAVFYDVWSDLLTVASYLQGVSLWQQVTTTDAGTVVETVTLFNLLVALLIVIITYVLVRNIAGILEVVVYSRIKLSQGTPYTINTLLTYTFIAIGGALAFSTLGISWSKLQWLFAALSLGIGFGMQEIFANFVSGIILLFERPIRVGDTVTINGVSGTVAKIRIRAITLIDFDRKEVIVPNKSFVTGQVINWALSNTVTRVVITVGVAYGSNLELVRQLLLQAAQEQPTVLKEPEPRAFFLSFGASTLDHELRVYVGQVADRTSTTDALNRRINELFAENNIDIAFNQLDVFIKNQDTGAEMPLISVNN